MNHILKEKLNDKMLIWPKMIQGKFKNLKINKLNRINLEVEVQISRLDCRMPILVYQRHKVIPNLEMVFKIVMFGFIPSYISIYILPFIKEEGIHFSLSNLVLQVCDTWMNDFVQLLQINEKISSYNEEYNFILIEQ